MFLLAPVLMLAVQTGVDPDELREEPAKVAPEKAHEERPVDKPAEKPPVEVVSPEERRDIAALQALEGRLSVGDSLNEKDVQVLLQLLASSPAPRARALAAAVLPWLDPPVAAPPLFAASRDADARVRATAGQSLVALARRLPDALKKSGVNVGISLLDDPSDEAACAGAELLAALNPPSLRDAFEVRAKAASDVRYACFVRHGGLPVRTVAMPVLPPDPDAVKAPTTTTPDAAPTDKDEQQQRQWLFLAAAAGTGLVAGGGFPGALVPSRDVLVYDDRQSKLSREEISFLTQGGAALLGAGLLAGAALGTEALLGPLSTTEATSVLGAAGAGTVLGAGFGFMAGYDGGGQSLALSLGSLGGFVGGAALAYGLDLSDDDNALMASAMAMGGLASALGSFTAVPVGLEEIFGAQRSDFGLGAGLTGAGLFGLTALGVGAFTDMPAARSAAVVAGGLLGGGLLTGLGFLIVPKDLDTGSRIACGLGLSGQVIGMALALVLIPDRWLAIHSDAVVDVTAKEARFGLPMPVVFAPLPGRSETPIGVTLLRARF
jgi:hypothetical protein